MPSNAVLEAEGSDLGAASLRGGVVRVIEPRRDVAELPDRFRILSAMDRDPPGGLISVRMAIHGVRQPFASHLPLRPLVCQGDLLQL